MSSLLKIIMTLLVVQTASGALTNGLYAAFDTSMGSFTCRLDYAEAPLTCANFVGLAEGSQAFISTHGAVVEAPFYDGLIFHRVIDGFMIQGGDPLGTGGGGPGYKFPDQISTNLTHHAAGRLSMANSGVDSNGSQFFITLAPTVHLDGKHAVFGEVIGGMNTVSNIGAVAVDANDRPLTNVVMNTVRILRIGAEAAAFDPALEPLPEVSQLALTLNGDVSAASSNQCEQFIFSSTNLLNWASVAESYSPTGGEELVVEISTNNHCGFYRGARAFYPETVDAFSDIAGRILTFTQGASVLIFRPTVDGLGSCDIVGNPDALVGWADWTSGPFPGIIFFEPVAYSPFYFTLSVNGSCKGYQWNGFQWSAVGLFEFSMAVPVP